MNGWWLVVDTSKPTTTNHQPPKPKYMQRYDSAEIRWFFPGEPGRELESWFRQSFTRVAVGRRTDLYLLGTGEALNIKLREGRLEIKQRGRTEAGFKVNSRVTGRRESWVKWPFDLAAEDLALPSAVPPTESWLPVNKNRLLRTFIPEMAEITETQAGSFPVRGCNAELTFLEVSGAPWYTVGLEAFGEKADRSGLLHSVADYFFDRDFPLILNQESSYGYAAWIEKLQNRKR